MKVLFIGDTHLKITRFVLAKQFLNWIADVVELHKPDLVVNLGDTFDTHAVVRSEVMHEFTHHVDHCLKSAPYVYLVGNHDCFKPNDMKYHALSHLVSKIHNLYIVDRVQDLFGMTFVPYTHDISLFPKKTLEICVAHQTFKGADYGDITTKDGVDPESVEGCEIIISGHIHKRHRLDSNRVPVLYPGSPFSQSASDIDQIKGISIIDTSTYKEQFIQCPLPMWKGLKYEISQNFSLDEVHEDLMIQLNDKDHWVVEITGPKAEILGYLGSKNGKSIISSRDVKIKTIFTDKEKRKFKIEAVSLDHIISCYVDQVYSGSIDKDRLKSEALEIISKLVH